MRLAGFKIFLNQLLERLDVDAAVFTEYIIGLLQADGNVVSSIAEWLNVVTQLTPSSGSDNTATAEAIKKKFSSIRGEDSDYDDDDDACIEDYLREQGADIYNVDLGPDGYDNDDEGYNNGDVIGESNENNDMWVKEYDNAGGINCNEGWQEGYNNDWTEEEIRNWEEQEAYNQQQQSGEYQSFDYETATGYDYALSEGAAYDYGLSAADSGHVEAMALVGAVRDCLLLLYPSLVFSEEAIYSVLTDAAGDAERAARSIEMAYNEAAVCKPCRYMMTGKCYKRGCVFQHGVAGVTCRFWLLDSGCAALSADEGGACPFQHKVFPLAPAMETEIESIYRAVSEFQLEAERATISASDFPALPPISTSKDSGTRPKSTVRYANAVRGKG